jgi:hypothetical protein
MAVAPPDTLFDVITDFLATEPTADQIIAYRLPQALEQRALDLLERNRQNVLTPEERAEMDEFLRINHLINMLKYKVRLKLAGQE